MITQVAKVRNKIVVISIMLSVDSSRISKRDWNFFVRLQNDQHGGQKILQIPEYFCLCLSIGLKFYRKVFLVLVPTQIVLSHNTQKSEKPSIRDFKNLLLKLTEDSKALWIPENSKTRRGIYLMVGFIITKRAF